jgi:hypothetical protein
VPTILSPLFSSFSVAGITPCCVLNDAFHVPMALAGAVGAWAAAATVVTHAAMTSEKMVFMIGLPSRMIIAAFSRVWR